MNPTDDLPRAVANWVSMVIQQLNAEQTEVLRSCLEAPGPDVRVVFCMREGAVLLEVSSAGRRLENRQHLSDGRSVVAPHLAGRRPVRRGHMMAAQMEFCCTGPPVRAPSSNANIRKMIIMPVVLRP